VNTPSAGARAVTAHEIEDVVLIESACKVHREFNPTMVINDVAFAHRISIGEEVVTQTRTPVSEGEVYSLVRYFLNAEVRLLKPGAKPNPEAPSEDDFMASLNFVFAVDYRCAAEALLDRDAIGAFSTNAQFHAWPFVREEIHAMCGRLRIPRLTIPMLKPAPLNDASGNLGAASIKKELAATNATLAPPSPAAK
jgi:hypothetical protein